MLWSVVLEGTWWGVGVGNIPGFWRDTGKGAGDDFSFGVRARGCGERCRRRCWALGWARQWRPAAEAHGLAGGSAQGEPAELGWVKAELLGSHISSKKSHQPNSF